MRQYWKFIYLQKFDCRNCVEENVEKNNGKYLQLFSVSEVCPRIKADHSPNVCTVPFQKH